MDDFYFEEGSTLLGERLYQVTWLKKTGFIYDRNNLSKVFTSPFIAMMMMKFTHEMKDGWGLATDGKILFGSDGSSTLYQLDPQSMKVIQKHTVRCEGLEAHDVNELEFVNGEVWANVWQLIVYLCCENSHLQQVLNFESCEFGLCPFVILILLPESL